MAIGAIKAYSIGFGDVQGDRNTAVSIPSEVISHKDIMVFRLNALLGFVLAAGLEKEIEDIYLGILEKQAQLAGLRKI